LCLKHATREHVVLVMEEQDKEKRDVAR